MADKILVESKLLNSLLKAVEIHLDILQEGGICIQDPVLLNRVRSSVEMLKDSYSKINSIESDIKKMKRKAYSNYIKAKEEYEKALKSNDATNIKELDKNKKTCLELYLNLKKVAEQEAAASKEEIT